MRNLTLWYALLAAGATPLAAQGRDDTAGSGLRSRIEHRFAEDVKRELRLTEDQATRLKAIAKEHGGDRKRLRHRERELRAALDAEIDDSAASQDSIARLTRELLDLRVEYAESWRKEMSRLSFLTPAQRARLLVMRENLIQRVHEMRGGPRGYRGRGEAH